MWIVVFAQLKILVNNHFLWSVPDVTPFRNGVRRGMVRPLRVDQYHRNVSIFNAALLYHKKTLYNLQTNQVTLFSNKRAYVTIITLNRDKAS